MVARLASSGGRLLGCKSELLPSRTQDLSRSIRSSEPRKCTPPFKMVILDRRGTVVFECKVNKDGRGGPSDWCAGYGTLISPLLHCLPTARSSRARSSSSGRHPVIEARSCSRGPPQEFRNAATSLLNRS